MRGTFELPSELVAQLVAAVKAEVLAELEARESSPYLTISEASEYARCSKQRLYDLRSSGRLSRVGDGSRALVLRDELEQLLTKGR